MAEDKKDTTYPNVSWASNLKHRPDPNRVSSLQTPTPGHFEPRPAAADIPPDTATLHIARPAPTGLARRHDPQSNEAEPSYYNLSPLKQPVWKWEIACYFFLGGVSAGAYVLGRAAERFGGDEYQDVSRLAAYVAMGTLIPCPPLLIADLGDPKRFHHMLRVWKPSTPMNFGTWSIVAYSGMAAFEAARQSLTARDAHLPYRHRSTLLKLMDHPLLLAIHDAVGVPFAIIVAGYTGVLLSCTANPLWCKNPYLGPLFSASALSTGAEALNLALDLTTAPDDESRAHGILNTVDTLSHAAELATSYAFMKHAGEGAEPLKHGKMRRHHQFATGALIAAEVLKALPVPRRFRRPVRITAAVLGLAAGFALRWSMVYAGHEAAANPRVARSVSRGQTRKTF